MNILNKVEKNKVIKYLKDGCILKSVISNDITFFKYINDFIYVKGSKSSYYLSVNDFCELFFINDFYLYENEEQGEIDFERDSEYYSMDPIKK